MPRRLKLPAALLAALVLAGAGAVRAPAGCRCDAGSLELVIVLDTTSSMAVMIGTVKEQLRRLIAVLEGGAENLRVGIVLYRTSEGPEYTVRSFDLSSDRSAAVEWMREARARGGGYEAVEKGLEAAVTGMKWTKGSRKVIVLVGDEGPRPDQEERCFKLARLAKERGIAVSTITCSDTAWRYWQLVHSEEWKQRKADLGEERAMAEFQLPIFRELAENGGGLAASSKDTKEMLKWLLVFASGRDDIDEDKVKEILEWEPPEPDAEAGHNPMLAQLAYRGEWNTPRNFEALRAALGEKVDLDFDSGVEVVKADDERLAERPVLYLTGHGAVDFSVEEKRSLGKYLAGGGLLWVDNCCARPAFDASFRKLAAELAPDGRLKPLAADHPVYRAGYVIEKVAWADQPRTPGTTFTEGPPRLEGTELNGRLAIIYSPNSLGCGWASYLLGKDCQLADEDARKLSMNILLYALTAARTR